MVDLTQLVLFAVIIILTILLVVIGIQVFLVLKDLRRAVKKIDLVAGEASEVSSKIKGAIDTVLDVKLGVHTFSKVVSFLKEKTKDEEKKEHERED